VEGIVAFIMSNITKYGNLRGGSRDLHSLTCLKKKNQEAQTSGSQFNPHHKTMQPMVHWFWVPANSLFSVLVVFHFGEQGGRGVGEMLVKA